MLLTLVEVNSGVARDAFTPKSPAYRDPHCQGPEDFTSCLRILKHTDTLEAVQDVQRFHRMEKRQSHITMNAWRESERSWGEL